MAVMEQRQLANVKSMMTTYDDADDDEQMKLDIPVNSLVQSTKQGELHVKDLAETSGDHVSVSLSCEDGEFDHFEEVQER